MAIAEHAPDKLYARNAGMLKISHEQLHDFAATPEKGLPKSKVALKLATIKQKDPIER